jgi:hypothetical protein
MRTSGGPVGPRGATVLLVAAVAAGLLAVHGWSTRHTGLSLGNVGVVGPSTPATPHPSGHHRAPSASSAPSPNGGHAPGPLLSSQSYASYSYLVWPGVRSAAAKAAMTGLSITVHRTGSGVSVAAGVSGRPAAARVYRGGARVYVVEASMGDEAVTDAQGRIVQ